MTREEIENSMTLKDAIEVFKSTNAYGTMDIAKSVILKALGQESCDDEFIKVPKKALKYRTAGMVAYNAEWLKNHFDIERAVICGAQQSILDKIRAEIMQLDYDTDYVDYDYNDMVQTETIHTICREEVIQIIDKYKTGEE